MGILSQLVEQIGDRIEQDGLTIQERRQASTDRQVGFSDPWRTQQQYILAVGHKAQSRPIADLLFVDRGLEGKVGLAHQIVSDGSDCLISQATFIKHLACLGYNYHIRIRLAQINPNKHHRATFLSLAFFHFRAFFSPPSLRRVLVVSAQVIFRLLPGGRVGSNLPLDKVL